jgi:hypothetical protein
VLTKLLGVKALFCQQGVDICFRRSDLGIPRNSGQILGINFVNATNTPPHPSLTPVFLGMARCTYHVLALPWRDLVLMGVDRIVDDIRDPKTVLRLEC